MSLYPPPEIVNAEIFSPLPERFRVRGRRSAWAEANHRGRKLHSFLEGPCFDAAATSTSSTSRSAASSVSRRRGQFSLVAEYDGEPNGLKILADGRIFIADYKNGIMRARPRSGAVTPSLEPAPARALQGRQRSVSSPPTATCTSPTRARPGCTTRAGGSTGWRRRPARPAARQRAEPERPRPQQAETTLFVAVTRENAVWRVPLLPDGGVTKVGVFIQLSGGTAGPTAWRSTPAALFVAHPGMGCVWHFDRLGQPKYRIVVPDGVSTTNVAFGETERRTLFITKSETGTIYKANTAVPGHPALLAFLSEPGCLARRGPPKDEQLVM